MTLTLNKVLMRGPEYGSRREIRIVAFHPNGKHVAIVEVFGNPWPKWHSRQELERGLETKQIVPCERDPYSQLKNPKYDDDPRFDASKRKRDASWRVIEPLVHNVAILEPRTRGPLVKARAKETGINPKTIYKWLKRWWQCGMMKNALVPFQEWNGHGGRKPGQRLGDLSKFTEEYGGRTYTGIQAIFVKYLRTYYDGPEQLSLAAILNRIKREVFVDGQEFKDGQVIPILKPEEHSVNKYQLRYFFRTHWRKDEALKKRQGKTAYARNRRALSGGTSKKVRGPGSCFQLDAYESDLILVSRLNQTRVIGKVVLCFVVDQFTHMIVGFSISVRKESYLTYAMAINNAATLKKAYCRQFDRTISEKDWPAHHLAEHYVFDRGPLRKWLGNHVVNALGVDVDTPPPYRPDLKPLVERVIGIVKEKVLRGQAGATTTTYEGGKGASGAATITIDVLTAMVIEAILAENQRPLDKYKPHRDMVADGVVLTPLNLWHWGVENRTGSLREEDADTLRLNLMPLVEATITPEGLVHENRLYECDVQLRERARREGHFKVDVSYDPRINDVVYRRLPGKDRSFEICPLAEADDAWLGTSADEHTEYQARMKQPNKTAREAYAQAEAERDTRNEAKARAAKQQHRQALKAHGMTKNDTADVSSAKAAEQRLEDQKEGWRLSQEHTQKTSGCPDPSKSRPADTDDPYWDSLKDIA